MVSAQNLGPAPVLLSCQLATAPADVFACASVVAVTLTATTFSTRSFLSGVLALQSLNLRFKLLVLFRQRIAGSCHCLEIVSDLAVLFLKFRHLGLQLLVLLQSFCVFAGRQRQTQNDRHTK